jgi:hypothetical protein
MTCCSKNKRFTKPEMVVDCGSWGVFIHPFQAVVTLERLAAARPERSWRAKHCSLMTTMSQIAVTTRRRSIHPKKRRCSMRFFAKFHRWTDSRHPAVFSSRERSCKLCRGRLDRRSPPRTSNRPERRGRECRRFDIARRGNSSTKRRESAGWRSVCSGKRYRDDSQGG